MKTYRGLLKIAIYFLLLEVACGKVLWEFPTGFHNPQAMTLQKGHLYVAIKEGGVKVLTEKGGKPKVVSHIKRKQLANLDAMNLWLAGDTLFVALGDFFKKKGHAGLAVIDVRIPSHPNVLSVWKSPTEMRGSAVVICDDRKRYAYLGVMEYGILIFDLFDLKKPKLISSFRPDIHFPKKNPNRIQMPNARGMMLTGKRMFLCNDAGGIRVLDLTDPRKPREISRYINTGLKGKPSAYNNIYIDGDLAYAGVEILDIRKPERIRQLAWWNPWKADTNANNWFNSPGHTNQITFDKRNKILHLSAGDSELVSLDLSNPKRPKQLVGHGDPKNERGVWGLCRSEQTVYLGYIKTIIPFRGTWAGIKAVKTPD